MELIADPTLLFLDEPTRLDHNVIYLFTANSDKVVFQKSKIQITKYKIQEKECHVTHKSGLLLPVRYITVREDIFC